MPDIEAPACGYILDPTVAKDWAVRHGMNLQKYNGELIEEDLEIDYLQQVGRWAWKEHGWTSIVADHPDGDPTIPHHERKSWFILVTHVGDKATPETTEDDEAKRLKTAYFGGSPKDEELAKTVKWVYIRVVDPDELL